MHIKNTRSHYGLVTKLLHAVIAIMVILQFMLIACKEYLIQYIVTNGELIKPVKINIMLLHKSIGFSLLFVGLLFVLWRLINSKPAYPSSMARWEMILANANHHLLYLLVLIMPLTGVIMSMSSGKGLQWFGYPVPNILPLNEMLAGFSHDAHSYLAYVLLFLLILHIAGALKHYYIDKNNILQRMWR